MKDAMRNFLFKCSRSGLLVQGQPGAVGDT
jgi:hypothetical protein